MTENTQGPNVTPLVRGTAQLLGVDLGTVAGTGWGGRIRVSDVQNAAAQRQGSRAAATGRRQPRLLVTKTSIWTPKTRTRDGAVIASQRPTVEIDVFSRNPLVDDMKQAVPAQYAEAVQRSGTPPTLFATADLPLFTASGVDPELLLMLPWVVRHAAASIAAGGEVSRLFEDFGTPNEDSYDAALAFAATTGWDVPNQAYEERFRDWGTVDPYEAQRRALFGATDGQRGNLRAREL